MTKGISIGDLKHDQRNPRKHNPRNLQVIVDSLHDVGFARSIVIDEDNTILAGNGVTEAAAIAGIEKVVEVEADGNTIIAVRRRGLTDEQKQRLKYFDNRSGELAEWEPEQLLIDIGAGLDLSSMFREDELDTLLQDLLPKPEVNDAGPQVDRADELRVKWQVESGQLWQLGEHRLICGDCTDVDVVERVMGGDVASLMVTSPPYGVGKDYEDGGLDEWKQTIGGMLAAAEPFVPLMAINLGDVKVGPNHREIHSYGLLVDMCESAGFPLIGTRIWIKQPAWAQGPYWLSSYRAADDYEYIGLFGESEYRVRTQEDWRYRGVWEITSVAKNDLHSAMFPVELPERLIKLLCDENEIVYEPFSGSGTTIIACEQLGRKCRAVEISPGYVGVALERYFQATGKTPVLIGNLAL